MMSARAADVTIYVKIDPNSPAAPRLAGITGKVEALITLGDANTIASVDILSEDPREYGFGEATQNQLKTWTIKGPKGGTYRVDVIFSLDPSKLAPPGSRAP
jgi:hypothetical protein